MASEFKKKLFWRAVVAEFLAMILFVFISIGSALGYNYPVQGNKTSGAPQDNVKVSLAFGLSIATLAQSVGHISGAHLNPAVTLGLLLSCQISVLRALMYIVAQSVGAIVATAILSGITSSLPGNTLGLNGVSGPGTARGPPGSALCPEGRGLGPAAPASAGPSAAGHSGLAGKRGPRPPTPRGKPEGAPSLGLTPPQIFRVGPSQGALAALIYDFILAPRSSELTDRMKVWTSGQAEEYDLDADDLNSRVEMKPK
uniref:Aquaporin-1 n=1 Tax=Sarcophilus harrisii TaxID=9305 RepID=A0A7N4NY14_SARHA